MIKRIFGKTGLNVSAIGQGCWNIGNQWGDMTDEQANAIIMTAYENGVNLFDVADAYGIPYGLSEMRLGKALKDIRNKVFLVSKMGHWGKRTGQDVPLTTPDMIRLCGHASLGRLRTEYIDVMLCHDSSIKDPSIYIEGFNSLVSEGSIREYGISTNNYNVLKTFYDMSGGKCAVVELDYSIINKQPEVELFPFCKENNIGILAHGPMAMGLLAGKYNKHTKFTDTVRSSWNKGNPGRASFESNLEKVEKVRDMLHTNKMPKAAIKYVISNDLNIVAIPGATSTKQVLSNCKAGESLMDKELYSQLKNLEY